MRCTPRTLAAALPVLIGAAALSLPGAPRARSVPRPTIEPTLPLVIDLRILPQGPADAGGPRLVATLDAASDLRDVTLRLDLPPGVSAEAAPLLEGAPLDLRAGDRRVLEMALRALRTGDHPLRLLASFRVPDGRLFRTSQGALWRTDVPPGAGRLHAGAYEWMAVPVSEPRP